MQSVSPEEPVHRRVQDSRGIPLLRGSSRVDRGEGEKRKPEAVMHAHVPCHLDGFRQISIRLSQDGTHVDLLHELDQVRVAVDMSRVEQELRRLEHREVERGRARARLSRRPRESAPPLDDGIHGSARRLQPVDERPREIGRLVRGEDRPPAADPLIARTDARNRAPTELVSLERSVRAHHRGRGRSSGLPPLDKLEQVFLDDLPGPRGGKRVEERDARRHFVVRQAGPTEGNHVARRDGAAVSEHDGCGDNLTHDFVRRREHSSLSHLRHHVNGALNLDAVHILAANEDHVLRAVYDGNVSVGAHDAQIAGSEPSAVERHRRLPSVTIEDVLALDVDLADRSAIRKDVSVVLIENPNVHQNERPSRRAHQIQGTLQRPSRQPRAGQQRHRYLAAALGHSVAHEVLAPEDGDGFLNDRAGNR